jgi:hypothetical protein
VQPSRCKDGVGGDQYNILEADFWLAWSGAEKITKTERHSIGPTDHFFFGTLSLRLRECALTTSAGEPTRLTDQFPLIADAALAFVRESLHACENRIGVEMRFRDHVRFEAAASPGIVEVGGE